MSGVIAWIAAEAEQTWIGGENGSATESTVGHKGRFSSGEREEEFHSLAEHERTMEQPDTVEQPPLEDFMAHSFSADLAAGTLNGATEEGSGWFTGDEPATQFPAQLEPEEVREEERRRRIYRGRTIAMLRRYLRYSIETGRLPSLLGREFFRSKVTSYSVDTFEDRVIFVHDMEMCLDRLDEFSRQLIARHILQEHDQEATARLLQCTDRTVRTYVPIVLDTLSDILLELGLMQHQFPKEEKPCQGGLEGENFVSGSNERKNNF